MVIDVSLGGVAQQPARLPRLPLQQNPLPLQLNPLRDKQIPGDKTPLQWDSVEESFEHWHLSW